MVFRIAVYLFDLEDGSLGVCSSLRWVVLMDLDVLSTAVCWCSVMVGDRVLIRGGLVCMLSLIMRDWYILSLSEFMCLSVVSYV